MAYVAFFLSMITGILLKCMGFSEIGLIATISIMGAFIVRQIEKIKEDKK